MIVEEKEKLLKVLVESVMDRKSMLILRLFLLRFQEGLKIMRRLSCQVPGLIMWINWPQI
jgi:hypothetical protein